jgi:hypothetical protein
MCERSRFGAFDRSSEGLCSFRNRANPLPPLRAAQSQYIRQAQKCPEILSHRTGRTGNSPTFGVLSVTFTEGVWLDINFSSGFVTGVSLVVRNDALVSWRYLLRLSGSMGWRIFGLGFKSSPDLWGWSSGSFCIISFESGDSIINFRLERLKVASSLRWLSGYREVSVVILRTSKTALLKPVLSSIMSVISFAFSLSHTFETVLLQTSVPLSSPILVSFDTFPQS